jgi:uncharacterized protein YndB with AHSA1/START domain
MLRKFILPAVGAVVLLLVVAAGFVASRPAEFTITRAATLRATPEAVFAQVNDFHKWQAWSPWAELDRAAKNTFEGPEAGAGAIFRWSGNDQVGEGCMTLVASEPHQKIEILLEFTKPFVAKNDVRFTFVPQGDQTLVTWSMSGRNDFMGKLMDLFLNFDKMCGDQFLEGLEKLRGIVEAPAK